MNLPLEHRYPVCKGAVSAPAWSHLMSLCDGTPDLDSFPDALAQCAGNGIPAFLPDLARLELTAHLVLRDAPAVHRNVDVLCVNPALRLLELSWKGLSSFFESRDCRSTIGPGAELVLIWPHPDTGSANIRPASSEDLLVLKMAMEGIAPDAAAKEGPLSVDAIDAALRRGVRNGILLAPPSRIRRDPSVFQSLPDTNNEFLESPSFTLQWHITQACDLHCKHCYDRSDRPPISLDRAISVLDDLRAFCGDRNVQGAVSFSGGNPFLHPHFTDIYRAAADRGFSLAILGNPSSRDRMEEIIAIRKPAFFQVSLEGLPEHNNAIRGAGHFERIMTFLDMLRELDVYTMVMLTLTRENMDQVISLGRMLRDRADVFHFNRLSLAGEGANLRLPSRDAYRDFLNGYLRAMQENPLLGLKDNLFNILRQETGRSLFGGCTGYGCGAAFNFVSLLADGEVHACRKFASPIGNITQQSLADIYDSPGARQYRLGPEACRSCAIRPVCGGCLASAHSHGLDIFEKK
ncbi:MAG TPA: thio(seleno)oxazole modification radical SAM maturase SbtM, partial [Nitrospirota bacterium]